MPQPVCTATYCLPPTSNDIGTPFTPDEVGVSHSTFPFVASNARNFRSLVPPSNTTLPAVTSTGPQVWLMPNGCVHTFLPVSTFHACNSPI